MAVEAKHEAGGGNRWKGREGGAAPADGGTRSDRSFAGPAREAVRARVERQDATPRKPWEFKQKGSTLKRERRRKLRAARPRGKR